jgi:hypothetical protein
MSLWLRAAFTGILLRPGKQAGAGAEERRQVRGVFRMWGNKSPRIKAIVGKFLFYIVMIKFLKNQNFNSSIFLLYFMYIK